MTMFFGVLLTRSIGLKPGDRDLALPLLATQVLWVNLVTDERRRSRSGLIPRTRA